MIHGTEDIGWARIGAEISWGSSSLASAATFLSDSVTFDVSGALIDLEDRSAGFVEHAIKSTNNGTGENRVQAFRR